MAAAQRRDAASAANARHPKQAAEHSDSRRASRDRPPPPPGVADSTRPAASIAGADTRLIRPSEEDHTPARGCASPPLPLPPPLSPRSASMAGEKMEREYVEPAMSISRQAPTRLTTCAWEPAGARRWLPPAMPGVGAGDRRRGVEGGAWRVCGGVGG